MKNKIRTFVFNILELINKINPVFFIFLLLFLNFSNFLVKGNEENYFAWAKHTMQPNWLSNSFLINEFPGSRIIYEFIVGTMLKFFSFETTAFIGKTFTSLCFAFPLAKIFKKAEINNIELAFLLQLLFFPSQTFFADEFIFGTFESKTLAYIFAFWAYYYIMEEKFEKSYLFTLISTYFHILVGGWLFVILNIYLLWKRYSFKKIFLYSSIFIILLLPLLIYLVKYQFIDNQKIINGFDIDKFHVYVIAPFHLGITKSFEYFCKNHLSGVLIALISFIICIITFYRHKNQQCLIKNKLLLIIFSIVFISLIISLIDRTGVYLKYYPFRKNAIGKFLFLVFISELFLRYYIKESYRKYLNIILLAILLPSIFSTAKASCILYAKNEKNNEFTQMSNYIQANTDKSSSFFVNFPMYGFMRKTNRDQFFLLKFVPLGGRRMYEFSVRWKNYIKIRKNINELFPVSKIYNLDYLVTDKIVTNDKLTELFHTKTYHLYRIEKD